MPGSIQVTVVEFKGDVSSPSKASAKSLKVAMGKTHFQTLEKGDFSFPITKVGENLVVSLLDAGGNDIAHQDIGTMQIIEKGNWDEVFAINGCGHVHMKLRFVLSEEERHRIRLMRESAVKKKLETNPNIKLRLLQVSDSVEMSTKNEEKISDEVSPKVEGSQAGSSSTSATSSADLSTHILETALVPVKELSDATDRSIGAQIVADHNSTQPPANVRSDIEEGPPSSIFSELSRSNKIAPKLEDNQDSLKKTRSNVKKMISALENTRYQEVKSLKKSSSVPAHLNRLFKKASVLSEDQESKPADIVSRDHESLQNPKEMSSTKIPVLSGGNDDGKIKISAADLIRQPTSETATSSGRIPEEQTHVARLYDELSLNLFSSNETSAVERSGSGRGTGLKSSTMIDQKTKLEEYYNEEFYTGHVSGIRIFPDNIRRLCITTAGDKLPENISLKPDLLDKKAMHETEFKSERKQEKNVDETKAGAGSSPNDSFNGVVGQVIKVAVIIGFGVLVLLTTQKQPQKKLRKENGNLFHVPEFV